jgi:hypothetical protein
MKEKVFSLSGDDFTVETVDGTKVCKCKGKVMSISDRKGIATTRHERSPGAAFGIFQPDWLIDSELR